MNIKKSIYLLKEIFTGNEGRKPLPALVRDLVAWIIRDRGGIYYFFIYGLYHKGRKVSDYMTIRDYLRIHDELDPSYYLPMLEDKVLFDRYIKSFGVPSPHMYGIISGGSILWLETNQYRLLDVLLDQELHAYCKQVTAFGGTGVFKVDVIDKNLLLNNAPASIDDLRHLVRNGKFILQKTLLQHPELNRLNPSCVNTIRVYTVNDGREVLLYGAVIRIGVNDSIVDNVTSENLATGIREDHYLHAVASTGTNPPLYFTEHPNTGVRFGDFKVPFLEDAYALCTDTHKFFDDFFFIAWDVAITPDGPVILEANPAADLIWMQLLYGGQRRRFDGFARKFRASHK